MSGTGRQNASRSSPRNRRGVRMCAARRSSTGSRSSIAACIPLLRTPRGCGSRTSLRGAGSPCSGPSTSVRAIVKRSRLAWEGGTLGVASAAAVIAPEPGAAQGLLPFRVGARLRPPTRCAAPPDTPDGTEVPATIALECDADPAACRRIAAFLEEVEYGALVTHLLTLRAFLPERFAALDESEPSPLLEFRRTWREALDRLAIKLRIPEYRLVAGDLETARSRRVTIAFLSAASSHYYEEAACEASGDSLQAHLTRDELAAILERLYAAPIGSPCACDTLAALLPTEASVRPQLGRALTEYRRALRAHFGALGKLSTPDFFTSLHRPAPTELDAARAQILGALISGG